MSSYAMSQLWSTPVVALAVGFGILIIIALIVSASSPTSLSGRRAQAAVEKTQQKPVVMNPLAKRTAPEIVQHVPAPRMEPKSFNSAPVAPKSFNAAPKSTLDATFDAYRTAMKASSLESRGMSIAQKMPSVPRSGFRSFHGKAADFLDSTNQSIDERLVAQFDSAL